MRFTWWQAQAGGQAVSIVFIDPILPLTRLQIMQLSQLESDQ